MALVVSDGALVDARRPWTTYSVGTPSRGIQLYNRFAEYEELFRTQPNLRLVTGFLARNIAQLNMKLFQRLEQSVRLERRDHDGSRVIHRPNSRTTRYRFFRDMVMDLALYDTFAAVKLRNPETNRLRLFRLPPKWVEPQGDGWAYPDSFRVLGSTLNDIPASAMVYFHGYNPDDPRRGSSPIDSLRRALAEDEAAGEWREQYWRGAGRISGVIERPKEAPDWSETARNRFREEWQALYAGVGPRAGTTPVLEEGMQFKATAFSAKDSEYLSARRLTREECAAAYFISPLFVGILEHANFSNVKEQHKHLYQDTLGPHLTWISQEFELHILSEFPDLDPDEHYYEFNLEEKLRGNFEEQGEALQRAVGAPWMTRNEGRSLFNRPPVPGGDVLVTPLNVIVGGQASPQDSAPRAPTVASRKSVGAKAVEELPAPVQGWVTKHVEVLEPFFQRQQAAVLSRLGAGQSLASAWDDERWDSELTTDLSGLSLEMATDIAAPVAEDFGGTYDESRAMAWLLNNARVAAEEINRTTFDQLADVVPAGGVGTRGRRRKQDGDEDDEDDPMDGARGVFEVAAGGRATEIAITRATTVGNFARHEAASQSGAPFKVWVVNSANSRHPEMDGETAAVGASFSNGARWPGDPALDVSERAGCTCTLEFST